MKNAALLVATLSVLIASAARVGAQAPQARGVIIERVIVRVNGEIFTQSQLSQRQIDILRDRNNNEAADPLQDAVLRSQLSEITPRILVDSVDELLLVQHGREMGAKFTDAQFNSAIENIKKQNKLDNDGLAKALATEGLTMAQLRQNFERTYLVQTVQSQELGPRINPTQEELRQYYNAHKDEFMTPETVTLREIAVIVPASALGNSDMIRPDEEAAAKAKIDGILARVRAGEDFAAVAKEVSDAGTKAAGGLIGSLNLADLNPVLRAQLEPLQVGGVVGPLKLARGYQLLKLEARAPSALEPFDKVNNRLEQRVREERITVETQKLLERLRAQALIEWKDQTFKQAYDSHLAAQSTP